MAIRYQLLQPLAQTGTLHALAHFFLEAQGDIQFPGQATGAATLDQRQTAHDIADLRVRVLDDRVVANRAVGAEQGEEVREARHADGAIGQRAAFQAFVQMQALVSDDVDGNLVRPETGR